MSDVWRVPLSVPVLALDEVHVWLATVEANSSRIPAYRQLLSADERERADRFHFEKDRSRHFIARGALREILSLYLGTGPRQLVFEYSNYGKPSLRQGIGPDTLSFNLSHSGDLIAYAIARRAKVGIDIEHVRPEVEHASLAARFFAAQERHTLATLPWSEQLRAFYACWTRKEAYIKAHGEGLAMPLDSFVVSFAPGESPSVRQVSDGAEQELNWDVFEMPLGGEYVGALVAEGTGWKPSFWIWQPDNAG